MATSEYFALVRYEDTEGNKEIVPIENIMNINPPVFCKDIFYDVFWSPDINETIHDARKRMSEIPVFDVGAGYEGGAGYYKARVLVVEDSRKAVEAKFSSSRPRHVSNKVIMSKSNTASSASNVMSKPSTASSSGVSSINETSKKRGRSSKKEPVAKRMKSRGNSCAFESEDENLSSCDESGGTNNEVVAAKLYEDLLVKYKKCKRIINQQQERINILHIQNEDILNLNLEYQKHMVKCRLNGGHRVPEIDRRAEPSVADKVTDKQPEVPTFAARSVEVRPSTATSTPRAAAVTSPIVVTVPPADELDQADMSGIGPLDVEIVMNEDTLPNNTVGGAAAATATNNNAEAEVPEVPEPNAPAHELPIQAEGGMEVIVDPVESEEMIEIHPSIKIPSSLWQGDFKTVASKPLVGYKHGVEGDRDFIKDVAFALWGFERLSTSSVTGKVSNVTKAKAAELNTDVPEPSPPLEHHKIEIVRSVLKMRVLLEMAADIPVERRETIGLENRTKIEKVRFEIGQKIAAIKKIVKRRRRNAAQN